MLKTHRIDHATTADGRQIVLHRRGDEWLIRIDGWELMSSRCHGSEEELARWALEAGGDRRAPRWLVGGLGMGFTLRACLDRLGPDATVEVAEILPAVVGWNRGPLGPLAGHPLDDPRVRLVAADVFDRLAPDAATFDAILLDVDNGPDALTLDRNRRLYGLRGLRTLRRSLRPGGVLTVWSADGDDRFLARLGRAGFEARCRRVRARTEGRGVRHVIFVAQAP